MRFLKWSLFMPVMIGALAIATGCGRTADLGSKFMSVDESNKTVTFQIIAGYTTANDNDNYNGYANGQMVMTVPVGYKVTFDFYNNGGFPADVGVYDGKNQLAFQGAGDSLQDISLNPQPGIVPGASEKITFTASQTGTFHVANFENRFPAMNSMYQDVGMWDVFKVVSSGSPSITTAS